MFDGAGGAADPGAAEIARVAAMARETLVRNSQQRTVPKLGDAEPWLLLAGRNQFAALWTRDFCFAALGTLAGSGSKEAVRGSLETLLAYQREDGLLPRRVGTESNRAQHAKTAIGIKAAGRALALAGEVAGLEPEPPVFDAPEYVGAVGGIENVDGNSLVVWVAAEYVRRTGDQAFARRWRPQLVKAVAWLDGRSADGLLVQGPAADWLDMTRRKGIVAYSNVLYVQALRSIGELTGDASYGRRAEETARRLVAALWDERLGRLKDTTEDPRFAADGNLLAVWLGVLDRQRSARVLDAVGAELRRPNGLIANVHPPYPAGMYPRYLALNGMQGYGSNAFVYPWTTSLYALAAVSQGRGQDARSALEAVARTTVRDGGFRECLEPDGSKPVKRPFQNAESDFSWSSGLFLKASSELDGASCAAPAR